MQGQGSGVRGQGGQGAGRGRVKGSWLQNGVPSPRPTPLYRVHPSQALIRPSYSR